MEMICPHLLAESLAMKEENRIKVLVEGDGTFSTICGSLEKLGFFNRADSISERIAAFPDEQRQCLQRSFAERQEGSAFYNALAVYPIAPKILDIQYTKIIDTIYLIKALLGDSIGASDACLDIGACTGFMPIILSSLCLGEWTGIDRSSACIEYAIRSSMEVLEGSPSPSFVKGTLDKLSKKRKFKLILNSRGPRMDPSGSDYTLASSLLEDGGLLIYVDNPIESSAIAKKIYNKSGLSLVYRDVVGGYLMTPGEFEAAFLSVFVKCRHELPRGDYIDDYSSLWRSHFMDYCNQDVMDQPELKTLCTMRERKRHSVKT